MGGGVGCKQIDLALRKSVRWCLLVVFLLFVVCVVIVCFVGAKGINGAMCPLHEVLGCLQGCEWSTRK